ncbi:MAG: tetratricopeptide repeat protein [Bacteroidia bacterium]|nr:tetratricopeptide repeat protein [Bacteroidia bacterium]
MIRLFLICNFLIVIFISLAGCKNNKSSKNYSLSDSTKNSVEQLTELINQNSNGADLFYYRASLFMKNKNNSAALSDMLAAVALDSMKAEYFLQLGDIYFSKLFIAQAISAFEKSILLDSKNLSAELKLAELYLYLKKYNDCLQHADNALRIDKTNAKAYFIKGFMFKETGDTTRAVSSFQTATEQNPEYFDSFIQLGNLFALKKNNLALQYYDKALQLKKNSPEALYGMAMFFQENEETDKAEELYLKIIESTPDYKDALFNLGYINLIYKSEYEKAVEYFSVVSRLDTGDVRAFYNRGLSFEQMKKREMAEHDYRKALKLSPDYILAKEGLERLGEKSEK